MLGKNRKVRGKIYTKKYARLPSSEATIFTTGGIHCTIVYIFQDICSYVRTLILFLSLFFLLHSQQESRERISL